MSSFWIIMFTKLTGFKVTDCHINQVMLFQGRSSFKMKRQSEQHMIMVKKVYHISNSRQFWKNLFQKKISLKSNETGDLYFDILFLGSNLNEIAVKKFPGQ